ncbi:MAG: T9SS type A sorting domain-containing protein [Chitinophagaceae bacterium]|nr:T9SS type A sorting domain-containing protein [Chitinophagaceae bacterium]
MKKQFLLAAFSCAAMYSTAQIVITDTVIMGPGYANQIWYSLPHDEMATQAKNNWDLAFRTSGSMGSSIMANHSGGGTIWVYPKAAKAGWATLDTNGLSTWEPQYNSETEWTGALGRYANPADAFDLGWGIYDMGTHYVSGDSVYIIKTQAGAFKKLIIDRLASSTYTFTYANIDGTDSTTSSIAKSTYSSKNFGYFSLDTKTAIDREPATEDWDLVFGQYATGDYASMGIAGYTVTGVLANDTLAVAKAVVDPATRPTYNAFAALSFSSDINGLGYNWKSTSGVIKDSNVYFIRRNNGDIWKLNFTGWISGVSGNGSAIFTKEQLTGTSIASSTKVNTTLTLSPNPAQNGTNISIVYHFEENVNNAIVQVYDLMGRVVMTQPLDSNKGLHAYTFNNNFSAGTYIISIVADDEKKQQKLIVQ